MFTSGRINQKEGHQDHGDQVEEGSDPDPPTPVISEVSKC